MLSPRDIQRKIRTVRNIQQICRAMRTVSSIKLRKAEERINAARPYADAMRAMVTHLGCVDYAHPLLQVHPAIRQTGYIVISADKGLAGGFNSAIIREALVQARRLPGVRAFPIGRKIADALRRADVPIDSALSPMGTDPDYRVIAALADHIGEEYANGALDQVDLLYTQYGGQVTTIQLLPIQPPCQTEPAGDIIYEPSPQAILDQLLPRYLRTLLYTAVLSSVAAEHGARVAAMSLATDNAEDLIHSLTLDYNKSRQAGITGELTDIVGAVEALS